MKSIHLGAALIVGAGLMASAALADMPKLYTKPGLWVIKTVNSGSNRPMTMKMCTDKATQDN